MKPGITPGNGERIGDVTAEELRIQVIDIHVETPMRDIHQSTEIWLRVNGKVVSRMHPERARRMGLLDTF